MSNKPYEIVYHGPDQLQWLDHRRYLITASDAATLAGYSDYQTPAEVMQKKTFPVTAPMYDPKDDHMLWGQYLEQAILQGRARLERLGGRPMRARSAGGRGVAGEYQYMLLRSSRTPWLGCSLDGLARKDGQTWVAEVKHPNLFTYRKWAGTVPAYYVPQLQLQMYVTGIPRALFVAHSCGKDSMMVPVYYDEFLVLDILRRLEAYRTQLPVRTK